MTKVVNISDYADLRDYQSRHRIMKSFAIACFFPLWLFVLAGRSKDFQ